MVVTKDTFAYLPTIDRPATSMNTVLEILTNAKLIRDVVLVELIIIFFDQAIYFKTTEILWKNPVLYKNILVLMGVFHTITMLVVIFGIKFGEAGLQDIAIESNFIEKGSVDRLLNGKHYNRGVRLHKLFHKVCMKLVLKGFITRISENSEQNSILEDLVSELELLCNDLKPSIFTNLLSSVHVAKVCLLLK